MQELESEGIAQASAQRLLNMILFCSNKKDGNGVWKAVGTCVVKFVDGAPSGSVKECYTRIGAAAVAKRMNEEDSCCGKR